MMKSTGIFISLAVFLAASCSAGLYPKEKDVLRLVTYNVGVFDKYEKSGCEAAASMMSELMPDVLILNELDSCAARTGHVDQLAVFLSQMPGYEGVFAPALPSFQRGAYGIGQAWNSGTMEVVNTFRIPLPKGDGSEPRALVVAEYQDVVVAGTHLEYSSKEAQMAQAMIMTDTLRTLYGSSGKPVFLCGDFNAAPDSPLLDSLRLSWDVLSPVKTTYPDAKALSSMEKTPSYLEDVPGQCIDYILILSGSAEYETVAANVCVRFDSGSALTASDHLPVYVDIRLIKD